MEYFFLDYGGIMDENVQKISIDLKNIWILTNSASKVTLNGKGKTRPVPYHKK